MPGKTKAGDHQALCRLKNFILTFWGFFSPVLVWHYSDCMCTASSSLVIKQHRTVTQCEGKNLATG